MLGLSSALEHGLKWEPGLKWELGLKRKLGLQLKLGLKSKLWLESRLERSRLASRRVEAEQERTSPLPEG